MKTGIAVASFVLGAGLAGAIVLAGQPTPDAAPARPAGVAAGRMATDPPAQAIAAADQIQRWAKASLDRPLFTPERRPFVQASADADSAEPLPRLSGIMITPAGRRAIFATIGSNKPEVAVEGGSVGRYLVQSISGREVVLVGPDGRHSLHPTFDQAPPVPPAAPPIGIGPAPAKEATP